MSTQCIQNEIVERCNIFFGLLFGADPYIYSIITLHVIDLFMNITHV